jgi:hypothetical protein
MADEPSSLVTLPSLPFRVGESPFLVKGTVFRGVLEHFDEAVAGGSKAAIERLPPHLVKFFDQPFLAASQFCYLPLFPLCAAVGQILVVPPARVLRGAADYVAMRDINSVYRVFLKLASPDMLVSRLPDVWNRYFNFGRMEYRLLGPRRFEVRAYGFPTVYAQLFGSVIIGWLDAGFRLTGAKSSRIFSLPLEADGELHGVPTSCVRIEASWG